MSTTELQQPTIQQQAPMLLEQVAGHVGHRTVAMGLRRGLIAALAAHPGGVRSEQLADELGLDPFLVGVWCQAAIASRICERVDDGYALTPHLDTLLLDEGSPAYIGGVFTLLERPEVFDDFEDALASGDRTWWNDLSPEWLAGVARTGTPFYTRLVPDGIGLIDGLNERLRHGGRIVDTACGAGAGLVRLAEHYPACDIVGVDGDPATIDLARERLAAAGLTERTELVVSPLEEFTLDEPATVVINNISMHECRDLDRATQRMRDALAPGGWIVISDFPFPDSDEGLTTVPGRVMSGIQFFEALIDDQLLPRAVYDDLLASHGFTDLGAEQLAPVHALTWARRP